MSLFVPPSPASPRPPAALRYGVALGTLTLAIVLSLLFRSLIGPVPFILFFAAVAVNAWYGGLRAGLLAPLLWVRLTKFFFIPSPHTFAFELGDIFRGAVF